MKYNNAESIKTDLNEEVSNIFRSQVFKNNNEGGSFSFKLKL